MECGSPWQMLLNVLRELHEFVILCCRDWSGGWMDKKGRSKIIVKMRMTILMMIMLSLFLETNKFIVEIFNFVFFVLRLNCVSALKHRCWHHFNWICDYL